MDVMKLESYRRKLTDANRILNNLKRSLVKVESKSKKSTIANVSLIGFSLVGGVLATLLLSKFFIWASLGSLVLVAFGIPYHLNLTNKEEKLVDEIKEYQNRVKEYEEEIEKMYSKEKDNLNKSPVVATAKRDSLPLYINKSNNNSNNRTR